METDAPDADTVMSVQVFSLKNLTFCPNYDEKCRISAELSDIDFWTLVSLELQMAYSYNLRNTLGAI